MYKPPVTIYETAIQTIMEEREGAIVAKIQSAFNVEVDKQELIRALQYDRNQYDKGYADGERDAMEAMVRCKECKHCSNNTPDGFHWCDEHERGSLMDDDFCSYGERKNDNGY